MSDLEHIVERIPRPDGGELRILRKTYNGSAPFTSLHRWYLDEASGELRPGKQNVTVRDADLPRVIAALEKIAAKVGGSRERAPSPRQRELPTAQRTGPHDRGPVLRHGGLLRADLRVVSSAVPPNELDAEAAVLSALMLEPAALPAVRELLAPEHFYADRNRYLYEAIFGITDAGSVPDPITIKAWLRDCDRLQQVGGAEYIAIICDATPAVANVLEHAKLIVERARRRRLADACALAREQVKAGAAIVDIVPRLAAELQRLTPSAPTTDLLGTDAIFAPLPPVNYLVGPLDLCAGAPALVAGYGFSGKTVAAQSAALSIAAALPVWSAFNARQGGVLHVDYEQGERLTRERYQRLAAGMLLSPSDLGDRLTLRSMPAVYLEQATEPFLIDWCTGFDLVIVDSLRAACPTLEENDSAVRGVLDKLGRVSGRTGAAFIVIHHARKPQRDAAGGAKTSIRGSGAIFDACSTVLVFEAEKGQPTRVYHEKARTSGKLVDDFLLRIHDVEDDGNPRAGLAVSAEAIGKSKAEQTSSKAFDELKERIVAYLREHGPQPGKGVLRERLAVNRDKFFAAMSELEANGQVVNMGTDKRPMLALAEGSK